MILDVPYLAHRANFAMGDLEYDGQDTSVLFSMMRDVVAWGGLFSTDRYVFCFDSRGNKRKEIYQRYKQNRKPKEDEPEEEKLKRQRYYEQVRRLQEEDLFKLGYRNVLWEDGYEADDVIASVCLFSLQKEDQAIVVSSDKDLLQLISSCVSVFDPSSGRRRTLQWFTKTYGISPCQWADVKAVAGCPTDNVRGIEGVGEKSAISFLTGRMNPENKRYKAIISGSVRWERNLCLVQLPYEGCPRYELMEDRVTKEKWRRTCKQWGLGSLKGLYPGR